MTSPLRKASPGSRIAPSPSTRTPRPAPHRRGRPRRRRRRAGASRCVGGAAAAGVAGPDRGQGRDDGRRPSLPLRVSRWRVTCFVSLALSQPKPPRCAFRPDSLSSSNPKAKVSQRNRNSHCVYPLAYYLDMEFFCLLSGLATNRSFDFKIENRIEIELRFELRFEVFFWSFDSSKFTENYLHMRNFLRKFHSALYN